jgi:hypothetical protein
VLSDDDLEAAVGAGVLTQDKADALRTFAAGRRPADSAQHADEEQFRFIRGFNDLFFAIGVVLLGGGIAGLAASVESTILYGIAAVVMWGLAELLVRRMRLVLPGIVIVLFFVAFVALAVPLADLLVHVPHWTTADETSQIYSLGKLLFNGPPDVVAIKATFMALSAAIFYARFRFPFALLLIAVGTVLASALTASHFLSADSELSRLLLLICGVVTFACAMRFDLSDRLRVTRRTDCAFWLHLLAAPLIVHPLIGLVTKNMLALDTFAAIMIVVIAILLAVVALIIDRRALLVSALTYLGGVIAYTLSRTTSGSSTTMIATLVILGAIILAIGVAWAPLRRSVMAALPTRVANRLPPAAIA